MGRYSDSAKTAHSASATRGADGKVDSISYAYPTGHGSVDNHVNLNGDSAREAAADLKAAGVTVHFQDGRCEPGSNS